MISYSGMILIFCVSSLVFSADSKNKNFLATVQEVSADVEKLLENPIDANGIHTGIVGACKALETSLKVPGVNPEYNNYRTLMENIQDDFVYLHSMPIRLETNIQIKKNWQPFLALQNQMHADLVTNYEKYKPYKTLNRLLETTKELLNDFRPFQNKILTKWHVAVPCGLETLAEQYTEKNKMHLAGARRSSMYSNGFFVLGGLFLGGALCSWQLFSGNTVPAFGSSLFCLLSAGAGVCAHNSMQDHRCKAKEFDNKYKELSSDINRFNIYEAYANSNDWQNIQSKSLRTFIQATYFYKIANLDVKDNNEENLALFKTTAEQLIASLN